MRAVRTDRGDVECEVVVDCGGMFAAEIGRLAGVRIPVVPMSHQYLVTERACRERAAAALPTLRDPDLLVYFRQEVDGLVMGGYERDPAPWTATRTRFDAIPADFNGRLLPEDWPRFEEISPPTPSGGCPILGDLGLQADDQRAGGVHPGQRVLPRRDRGRRASSSPPGSARTASPAPAGSAGCWPSGSSPASPSLDVWHMDIRRFGPHFRRRRSPWPGRVETYQTYYDIPFPGQQGRRRGRCGRRRCTAGTPTTARCSGRRPAGSGSSTTAATPSAGPALAARRLGRAQLVAGGRGRAPRHPATAGLFDESSFAKISVSGPAAADLLEWVCDNRVARAVGDVTYTQVLNGAAGSRPTSRSPGWPTTSS